MQTKLQFSLWRLVEDKSLKQIAKDHINDVSLLYLARVMTGVANPHPFVMESMCKNIPKEILAMYGKYVNEYNKIGLY